MGTRSTIAIEHLDGRVDQVYCHWDGYIENNGRILWSNYQDRAKVEELVGQGYLSSLGAEIGSHHSFDNCHPDFCTFYSRDGGERVIVHEFRDFRDYVENHNYQEYEYIFRKDNQWYVCTDRIGEIYNLLEQEITMYLLTH